MLKLSVTLSLRYIQEHKLRSLLTLGSIVFGVMLILSTTVMNRGILDSYQNMINKITGKSQIIARSPEGSFAEDYLPKLRQEPEVKDAVPSVQTFSRLVKGKQRPSIYLIGINPILDEKVRNYVLTKGRLPLNSRGITITKSLAQELRLKVKDSVNLLTVQGLIPFKVEGILNNQGSALANGGAFAVINLRDAQTYFGQKDRYNFIDLTLKEGNPTAKVIPLLKKRVNSKLLIELPQQRGKEIEDLLSSINFQINFISFSTLFVGVFLIYNTITVTVKERRKEIGTLRALGLQKRQITNLFLIETGILGILGSGIGITLGILNLKYLEGPAMEIFKYFLRVDKVSLTVEPENIFFCLALGIGAAIISSIFPVREGVGIPPIEALKDNINTMEIGNYRLRFLAGLTAFLIAVLVLTQPIKTKVEASFVFVMLLGATLMIPAIIKWGGKIITFCLHKTLGVRGKLAGESLLKSTQRTSITLASLMIGITIVIGMGGNEASQKKSLENLFSQGLVGDLVVKSATTIFSSDVPLRADLNQDLARISGVKQVDLARDIPYKIKGDTIRLQVREGQINRMVLIKGTLKTIKDRFKKGDGIMVSEAFADRQHKGLGDRLILTTPKGKKAFEIVGVYAELTSMKGAVALSYPQYKKYWEDQSADGFNILLKKGSNPDLIKRKIKEQYGEKLQLVVQTNEEFTNESFKLIESTQGLVKILEYMTMVVAFIGVLNTLIISVLERTREIGILRAVGFLRTDVRKMILIESGLIGITGGLFGTLTGSLFSYFVVQGNKYMNGFYYIYVHPWSLIGHLIVTSVIISLLAGLYPANRAGKMNIINAINYE